jgi:hypothetical protein
MKTSLTLHCLLVGMLPLLAYAIVPAPLDAHPRFGGHRNTHASAPTRADGNPDWVRRSINGNGSISQVEQPTLDGAKAYRFSVPDDGVSYRAELATASTDWGSFHYQFAIFLPQDWQPNPQASIVAQWHGFKLANGKDTNPPISLAVEGDHWRLMINHLASTSSDETQVEKQEFPLPAITKGVWHRFDARITWSRNGQDGEVTLLHDGEIWAHYTGINNYHQKTPPYFKVGIYHPQWNPRKQVPHQTGGPPIVVYTAGVSIRPAGH